MGYNINFRNSEITGANAVSLTETQLVVNLNYKQAGARGILLSEAPLKESPSTISVSVGGTPYTETAITSGYPSGTNFTVEYSSNSGVIFLPTGTALGTSCTISYKGLGSIATIESKAFNPDGSVSAPSISFESDTNTGLYRIGADNMGFAAGGVQTSQLNSLGVLNGSLGSDYRNLIQQVYGQNTGQTIMRTTNTWTTPLNTQYQLCLQGTITPRSASSVIMVKGFIAFYSSANQSSILRLYYNTTSYGTPQSTQQVALPGGTQIGSLMYNSQVTAAQLALSAPILGRMSGHLAGTQYFISLWVNYGSGQMVMNNSNTLSEMYFEEYV